MHFARLAGCFVALAAAASVALQSAPASAASDPSLEWRSLETPHFRVSYYVGEREIAERLADHAEAIYARMVPAIGWPPSERVELSVVDESEGANAFASALPYDAIHFYATAPDDLSPLGDVDDWYEELFTHEFTHILHTDHIRGVPALVNALIGKTLAPNQAEPRWMLEGLAVYEESTRTSGGRLRSSTWNMYMRSDVLEDNVATLDVISGSVRRWPQGNLWYLYGSFFMQWIAETYGEDAIRSMIDDYAHQVIPYAIGRSARRATGRTFEELYAGWLTTMRRDFAAQAAAIRARGLREGVRLTHRGQTARTARFIPKQAWKGAAGDVIYYRDDGRDTAGLYRLPITRNAAGVVSGAHDDRAELLVRTSGASTVSFTPRGEPVFDSIDVTGNLYSFYDLFSLPSGASSPSGLGGERRRLSTGFRATDPDVSPDGRRVVFVTNSRGTTTLKVADLTPEAGLSGTRSLVVGQPYDQVYAPRWSPDNRHVAYSSWSHGGFRDLRIVDTRDGTVKELTHDRAIDGGPCFSPDGARLFFHSDRSGVMNIYAYDLEGGRISQVTNTLTGAFQPAVSPDGLSLVYTGYTHAGYDLFGMAIEERRWAEAPPYVDSRPPPHPEPARHQWPDAPYQPLHTLTPRKYAFNTQPGNFGQAFSVTVAGRDLAGHHALSAALNIEVERPELQGNVSYTYSRLPFDWSSRVYRAITPGGGYAIGDYRPVYVQESVGAQSGLSYALPRAFDGQAVGVAFDASRTGASLPYDVDRIDPYATPAIPVQRFTTMLRASWSYSNAQRFLWSVGPEKGWSASANFDLSHPTLGSDYRGFRATTSLASYWAMPWLRHHALAVHLAAGTSGGSLPGSAFYVGGFVDVPFTETARSLLQQGSFPQQGGVVLRGYSSGVLFGRNLALVNAEYRFPIVNIDRGLSTLPIMLNRLSGNLFVDYGSAFDDAGSANFKTGVGAELWSDMTVGYFVGFTMRLGYARGLASLGTDKVYLVAVVPY